MGIKEKVLFKLWSKNGLEIPKASYRDLPDTIGREGITCFRYARGLLPCTGMNRAHILMFAQLSSYIDNFCFRQRELPLGQNINRRRINEHWSSWHVCFQLPSPTPSTPCPRARCHGVGSDTLPNVGDHSATFLWDESMGTQPVLQHSHFSTSAISRWLLRAIYTQDWQWQWMSLILATAAVGLSSCSLLKEIALCICYHWFS